MNDDERQARIAEIKHRHRTVTENVVWAGICVTCDEQEPCDAMTLLSELDAWKARAERAEDLCERFDGLATDLAKAIPAGLNRHLTVVQLRALQERGRQLMSERAALAEGA